MHGRMCYSYMKVSCREEGEGHESERREEGSGMTGAGQSRLRSSQRSYEYSKLLVTINSRLGYIMRAFNAVSPLISAPRCPCPKNVSYNILD